MKKLRGLPILLLMIYSGYSQVPNTNESAFPAEGNVLEGDWGTYLLQGLNAERTLRLGVANDGYTRAEIEMENNNTNSGKIIFKTTASNSGALERMTILNNGNIGIGVSNPVEKLDVDGSLRLGGAPGTIINPQLNVSDLNPGVTAGGVSIKGRKWGHFVIDIYGNDTRDAFAVRTDSNRDGVLDNIPFLVNNAGRVGIGTITPDAKLAVNGVVHSKEVKVDLNGWSDFVFKEDYNLPTLEEVEQHIKEKGHLKDIPNTKEVKENGIHLGEMDAKLLQKIEELTLYTIQQQKQIEAVLEQNRKLLQEIEQLKQKQP
ncbi:hypothetical protein LS482_09610 [Sinomicrobium kalidii]|uniref:hypothetical protein n=1 Tax=Sinomicrobium kalidii TaxID=2900738 RepID=UPI001E58FFA1|nr:hypothetical protein [Sinomicrobium kalidii]UGU18123.1 hypothetical protein LS482_09610 [Sinomicrobium kalidii]